LFGNASTETNVSDFKLNYSRVFHIMQKLAAENEDKSSDLTLLIGSGSQSPADRLKQMYSDVKALFDKTMLREKLPAPREIVSFKSQALDEELLKPKKRSKPYCVQARADCRTHSGTTHFYCKQGKTQ